MKLDMGWGRVELLPSAPYSVNGESPAFIVGLAFERQSGVHAVASGIRQDFDAWPGALACTAPGVDVFSESTRGGEYLTLHVACSKAEETPGRSWTESHAVFQGSRQAMTIGLGLRRQLLAEQPRCQHIEEHASLLLAHSLALLDWRPSGSDRQSSSDQQRLSQTMDYIEDQLHSSLTLQTLADAANMPLIRFLRLFTKVIGCTPHAYISERRLQRARKLLRYSGTPIVGIALDCGFTHQSHMGAIFKTRLGCTPKHYRTSVNQLD
jgi:AraC family transcriptional regulator